MDATTQLAFLIAELESRATTMERNANELRAIIARLRDNTGKIGAGDVQRETSNAARYCAGIDTASMWGDAMELVRALGEDERI